MNNKTTKTNKKKKLPKNIKDLSILTGICNLILAVFPGKVKKIKLHKEFDIEMEEEKR